MVPLALPLAILLASLMVFGNLGEHFELTALKSSGISLLKVMRPLMVLITLIAIAAFFFQNDVLPKAQVKMYTLLFSMRQKSPELEIPEGAFYDQISGSNLYVQRKNRTNGHLYDVMIYDVSKGYGYANVMLADSGKLSFTDDKRHLLLQLWHGESFQDMKDSRTSSFQTNTEGRLYERESFSKRDILISFDATFSRMDEDPMKSQYIGKNITELRHTVDSVTQKVDSVGKMIFFELATRNIGGVPIQRVDYREDDHKVTKVKHINLTKPMNLDTILGNALPPSARERLLINARQKASNMFQDYQLRGMDMTGDQFVIRRHMIEMLRKFTLSLACLIFFFIGAPLGAIIRKGGIGTPIVISVILFIIYYIIDNFGFKQARDGRWDVWIGIWMSSVVLLPLGIFLTYKAINDSAVFNPDAYRNFIRKKLGYQEARKLELKEVIIDDVQPEVIKPRLQALVELIQDFLAKHKKPQRFDAYCLHGFDREPLDKIFKEVDSIAEYLSNSNSRLVINKTMDLPIMTFLYAYQISAGKKWLGKALLALAPVTFFVYLIGRYTQKNLINDLKNTVRVANELQTLI